MMDLAGLLKEVEEGGESLLFQGGTLGMLAIFLFLLLVVATITAVWDKSKDKIKDFAGDHLPFAILVVLGVITTIFTRHFLSFFLVLLSGAVWHFAIRKMTVRKRKVIAVFILFIVLFGTYAGESSWKHQNAPSHGYLVLSFENDSIADKGLLVQGWQRFRWVLAQAFWGLKSVRVDPEKTDDQTFSSLSVVDQQSTEKVIEYVRERGFTNDILLRNQTSIDQRENVYAFRLFPELTKIDHGEFAETSSLPSLSASLNDVDHVALRVSFELLKLLNSSAESRLSEEDEIKAKKNILQEYKAFLAKRQANIVNRAEKLLSSSVIADSELEAVLTAYAPSLPGESGEHDKQARKALLQKLRAR